MTVKELISELQNMPDDLEVYTLCGKVESVLINPEYPLGDTANPNCKYAKVVYLDD